MKAIISTTYDDNYLFFVPIISWCWDKLGVETICFMPHRILGQSDKVLLVYKTIDAIGLHDKISFHGFNCPERKEVTYAQCSRLYASALHLPDDEILITADVDMAVFEIPPYYENITIFGHDLVPPNQYPICYASGKAIDWKVYLELNNTTYQKKLDELIGPIECENIRGNYWGLDQEILFNKTSGGALCINRARQGTQFASRRVDRDDANWRTYNDSSLFDAHLWRPGYTDENFANILELLTTQYPNEDFQWLINYRNEYLKLL